MLKLCIAAEVHTVEYYEIVDGSTFDPSYTEIDKVIEWPVVPRVGEWFDFMGDNEVIGRVLSVFHFRNKEANPEIRICCLVSINDYAKLRAAGWQST